VREHASLLGLVLIPAEVGVGDHLPVLPGPIRKFTKIYPYEAGGVGTSIAEFLDGKARLGGVKPPAETVFHEGSGEVASLAAGE
jgi:hypothetical protein